MIGMDIKKLKVKLKLMRKKASANPLFQLFLIAVILLPFAFLNLKGWYEFYYVIFALILFLIYLKANEDYFSWYFVLSIILFITAGLVYYHIAYLTKLNAPPQNITNPLLNFFIFFSFDFMLANIIYFIYEANKEYSKGYKSTEELIQETEELLHKLNYKKSASQTSKIKPSEIKLHYHKEQKI